MLTEEEFKSCLPINMRKSVNPQLMNLVNTAITDPEVAEQFRENIIGYSSVLKEGKFQMEKYLNAVHYCSYKFGGATNIEAYTKAFPAKYQGFLAKGVASKDIASYVTAYNKSKLVMLIMGQAMTPTHILNADIFQQAINEQAKLMMTASSEKVRSDAANSLLTHLKAPEVKKMELEVTHKEDSIIANLREAAAKLVDTQKDLLSKGVSVQDMAHSKLTIDNDTQNVV